MKKTILLLAYAVLFFIGITNAQQYSIENTKEFNYTTIQTPTLQELYKKGKQLENASPQSINTNRIAIKNAWEAIDPSIAQLYKPIVIGVEENSVIEIETIPNTLDNTQPQNSFWGDDIQIHDNRVDGGINIVAVNQGETLYATSYNNNPGGDTFYLNVYESTDMGETWEHFRSVSSDQPFRKARALTLDADSGDRYLLVYYASSNNFFRVLRWNLSQGFDFEQETIATDVVDFAVDRNWVNDTDLQRVFTVYKKTDDALYSARSIAGEFGFAWADETYLNNARGQVDIAYGRSGTVYVVMVSDVSNSMYVRVNDNFNDPASWSTSDLLENGADKESLFPTISAERLPLHTDNVLVVASSRDTGTKGKYNLRWYTRTNGNDFNDGTTEGSPAGVSYLYFDTFINYNEEANIQLGLLSYPMEGTENNTVYHRLYNGSSLSSYNEASNEDFNVFLSPFFKNHDITSIQIGADEEPLMVFCGTSDDETFGEGLYFDKESNILSTTSFDGSEFSVFPNPVEDLLHFNFPQGTHPKQISIADVTGKQILTQDLNHSPNTVQLDISHLQNGIYFITLRSEKGRGTKKIIKK